MMIMANPARTYGLKAMADLVRSIVDAAPPITPKTLDRITRIIRAGRGAK